MITLRSFKLHTIARTFIIAVMAVVLLTQSTVQAQSATFANNELRALTTKIKTEIDRRLEQTAKAKRTLEQSTAISASSKATVAAALAESEKALREFKAQLANIKDIAAAKELAAKVDAQYDQYASASATAATLKDGDTQQQAFKQLEALGSDAQSVIDQGGAAGMDVGGLQEQLKGLKQLIQSIGAIIASIIALITALATGNFAEASKIFQAILGQLAQNFASILTAQGSMSLVVDGVNGIQLQMGQGGQGEGKEKERAN